MAPPIAVVISSQGVLCQPSSYHFLWEGRYFDEMRACADNIQLIGIDRGSPCYVMELEAAPAITGEWHSLRDLLEHVAAERFLIASRAVQVLAWARNHRFCGRCGLSTVQVEGEYAAYCDSCQLHFYPRISPCVMVLITRGDECLLARNAAWRPGWYSALAGFVEAAESVEQALHREVAEEVSITITNLRYFASESWPFPGQLMLGFYADYQAGDIVVDGEEIAEAGWWRYDRLPQHPGTVSLSGRLIKNFVDRLQAGEAAP